MSVESDSPDDFFMNSENKELQNMNERLHRENNSLMQDLTTTKSINLDLERKVAKLLSDVKIYETETESLRERLVSEDRQRSEAQRNATAAIQEARMNHFQEMSELKSKVVEMEHENKRLTNDVSTLRRDLERATEEGQRAVNQLSKIFTQSEASFGRQFQNGDDLIAYIAVKPHFEAQQKVEMEGMLAKEEKLRHKQRHQKRVIRQCQHEIDAQHGQIKELEDTFTERVATFDQQIAVAEKEAAHERRSHARAVHRLHNSIQIEQSQKKWSRRMFVSREATVNIAPSRVAIDGTVVDKLKDKLRLAVSHIKRGKKEGERQHTVITSLKEQVCSLETSLSDVKAQKGDLARRLTEISEEMRKVQSDAETTERETLVRVEKAEKRLKRERGMTGKLENKVSELTRQLRESEVRKLDISGKVERIPCERIKSEDLTRVQQHDVPWDSGFEDLIPSELNWELRKIGERNDLCGAMKMRAVVMALCHYYNTAVSQRDDNYRKVKWELEHMEKSLSDVITTIGDMVLGRYIDLAEFMRESNLRDELFSELKEIRLKSTRSDKYKRQIVSLEDQNAAMTDTISRCKRRLKTKAAPVPDVRDYTDQIQNLQRNIRELEARCTCLVSERSKLQLAMHVQHSEFVDKLRDSRCAVVAEYEAAIKQLTKQCNEQRHTVRSMSLQLNAKAPRMKHY